MKKILLITILSVIYLPLFAQISFQHYEKSTGLIKVVQDNKTISLPFSGGMDVPQFSECDLNFDGKMDLVVFDREGFKLSTFINIGTPGNMRYEFAPEYVSKFPPDLNTFVIMADYNNDGKADMFTGTSGGFKLFKNTGNVTDGLSFQLMSEELQADYIYNVLNLYCLPGDMPSIVDVDDDGDLDIFSFSKSMEAGESIYWFRNMSMERYGVPDSLDYRVDKFCWGRFRESLTSCDLVLNSPTLHCSTGERTEFTREEYEWLKARIEASAEGGAEAVESSSAHPGSTVLVFDANGDGKKDVLIGDLTCTNMVLLENTNTNLEPIMTISHSDYPPQHPLNFHTFPAAFLVDVNNDGLKDLIAAPNASAGAKNFENFHLYLNNGENSVNRFDWQTSSFLEEEMIDVGEGSSPAFVDYNNDGLLDIVISNTGYYLGNGVYKTGLALYENTGTKQVPEYLLITRDWQGLSSLNIYNMSPSFADIDGDGAIDMVCGSSEGELHFFKNTAGPGNNFSFQYIPNFFAGIDVGNFSTPFLYDVTGDDRKEIIVGKRFNTLSLFQDISTNGTPNFVKITDTLWNFDIRKMSNLFPSGRLTASIQKITPEGKERLIVSNANGYLYILDTISRDINFSIGYAKDSLQLMPCTFTTSNGGFFFSMADIDDDGKPEIISGGPQGGVVLYKNNSIHVGIKNQPNVNKLINVYPNPANDFLNITHSASDLITMVELLDLNGRIIQSVKSNSSNVSIDIKELSAGMYVVKAYTKEGTGFKKVVVK